MVNPLYELPTLNFIGGSTKPLSFRFFWRSYDKPFDLIRSEARLSVVNHDSSTNKPVISKVMQLSNETAPGGANNVFTVTLQPEDTIGLRGRYIYMITIKNIDNPKEVEIPGKGVMYISNNIDKSYAVS